MIALITDHQANILVFRTTIQMQTQWKVDLLLCILSDGLNLDDANLISRFNTETNEDYPIKSKIFALTQMLCLFIDS